MVETYWNFVKQIYEAQGESKRAEYGSGLLKILSDVYDILFACTPILTSNNNIRTTICTISDLTFMLTYARMMSEIVGC